MKFSLDHRTGSDIERPFKVCLVHPNVFPTAGGYEKLNGDLVIALPNNIIIQVVCSGAGNTANIPSNVMIYPILKSFKWRYWGFIMGIAFNSIIFFKFLVNQKPNVVHAHLILPSAFISLPAKLMHIPIICTSHGADIQIDVSSNYGLRRNIFASWITKFVLRFIDIHTIVSGFMLSDAISAGSDVSKIKVIYNGINLENISPDIKQDSLKKFGIIQSDFIILFLGRLHRKKAPHDLIKAFSIISREIPNSKLIIAGRGDEEKNLKELAIKLKLNNILFTGFVDDDDKWNLLKRCDVFVLPSVIEGHPITLIEAMACGRPVIVTNAGPFPELVKHGETGLIIPLHCPEDIAKSIIFLYEDKSLREKLGNSARNLVKEKFDIRSTSREYLNLYLNISNR